ncbi:hypothetical protein AVEN_78943-1, partial [Araneus ventricosus]
WNLDNLSRELRPIGPIGIPRTMWIGWFGIYWRKSQIWPFYANRTVKVQHMVKNSVDDKSAKSWTAKRH